MMYLWLIIAQLFMAKDMEKSKMIKSLMHYLK